MNGITTRSPANARDGVAVWAVCALLLLAVALVFGQTVGHEFVNYDDDDYIYENSQVTRGLTSEGVGWAFTRSHSGNWHPLTWMSHMLDCECYGLRPGGHHLSNVLLHAATAILLFLALRQMTGRLWPSALVAVVFAVHPLRVESVAWVTERKDLLSGLFFMLTLAAYARYAGRPFSPARYLAVVVLFALGLMAKPMLVTLPFVLLLLDYWPLDRFDGSPRRGLRLIVEKIPLLLLAMASCMVTLQVQSMAFAEGRATPFSLRIANALLAYVTYLGQIFWPAGLSVLYPYPTQSLPMWKVAGASLVLAAITSSAMAGWRKRPYLLVGWLWYLGMLVPVIGLVQVGTQAMADRYTYLAQIGPYLVLVWGSESMCRGWTWRRWMCGAASALIVAGLIACAWRQATYWRNSETLWTHTLAHTAENFLAHNNFGVDLARQGRLDEAMAQYRSALEINPGYPEANVNLAGLLSRRGKDQEAIAYYERALRNVRERVEIHFTLGTVLRRQGRLAEAVACFEKALQIRPDYPEAHLNLGSLLRQLGRIDEAIARYRSALAMNPNYGEGHNNLGNALLDKGQSDEALAHYQRALEINPKNAEAHYNLANVLVPKGRLDEAISHFRKALDLNPDYADAHQNFGVVLFQQKDVSGALTHWRAAIRARPNSIPLLNQTAWALTMCPDASLRNGVEAVGLAQRAAQLSDGRDPAILDTLAAAYAEAGQFSEAVEVARRALALATAQGKTALAGTLQARIQLYQAGRPAWKSP